MWKNTFLFYESVSIAENIIYEGCILADLYETKDKVMLVHNYINDTGLNNK